MVSTTIDNLRDTGPSISPPRLHYEPSFPAKLNSLEWVTSLKIFILCLSLSSEHPSRSPLPIRDYPSLQVQSLSHFPPEMLLTVHSAVLSPCSEAFTCHAHSGAQCDLVLKELASSGFVQTPALDCECWTQNTWYPSLSPSYSSPNALPITRVWFQSSCTLNR